MLHLEEGRLTELLDGELDEGTVREINAHLDECAECARRLEQARGFMQESDLLIARLEVPPPARRRTTSPAAEPDRSRLRLYRNLAWAASLVLAAGLGFYASDRRRLQTTEAVAPADQEGAARQPSALLDSVAPASAPRQPAGHAEVRGLAGRAEVGSAATPPRPQPTAPVAPSYLAQGETKLAESLPSNSARASSTETAVIGGRGDQRDTGTAPLPATALPFQDMAALRAAPSGAAPQDAREADLRNAAPTPPVETVATVNQSSAPAEKYRVQTEPLSPGRVEAVKPGRQGLSLGALSRARPTAPSFHVISMDDAIRRLSGVIRLIDGLSPDRVESGMGAGVPGADAAMDVIRVVYLDPPGREIWLDQQRLPGPTGAPTAQGNLRRDAGPAVPDLLPGDTIIAMGRSNGRRVNWIDGNGFWLALSGHLGSDSLLTLARQVR